MRELTENEIEAISRGSFALLAQSYEYKAQARDFELKGNRHESKQLGNLARADERFSVTLRVLYKEAVLSRMQLAPEDEESD